MKDMTIKEALEAHPEARQVFVRHGMSCVDCIAVTMETIEAGGRMHGVDLEALLRDLNELAEGVSSG